MSIQSLSVFSNTFEGMCLCLKLFTQSAVEWMSTNHSSMLVSLPPMNKVSPLTKANAFLRLQKIFAFVPSGLLQTAARTFVWSQRESIGFPFTTFWSRPAMSFLLPQNTSRRSAVDFAGIRGFGVTRNLYFPTNYRIFHRFFSKYRKRQQIRNGQNSKKQRQQFH